MNSNFKCNLRDALWVKQISNFVAKLRALPENKKKNIIFTVIVISAIIMFFWGLKSTALRISEIKNSIGPIDFTQLEVNTDLPENNIVFNSPSKGDQDLNLEKDTTLLKKKFLTHRNNQYKFIIDYPEDWYIDNKKTDDLHIWVQKEALEEVASLHIEVIDKNEKIKSNEDGINYIISQMKVIIKNEPIKIDNLEGREVIGTICTGFCSGLPSDPIFSFSVIYFSKDDIIIKIKYGEGKLNEGWKKIIDEWKFYDEYKNIISTFKFN